MSIDLTQHVSWPLFTKFYIECFGSTPNPELGAVNQYFYFFLAGATPPAREPAKVAFMAPRYVPAALAKEIYAALHLPQYEGLIIDGEPVKQMFLRRIETLLEKATIIEDADATWRLRQRLDHIRDILKEKNWAGMDIEIGSTALKSLMHWADWRNDA